MARKRGERTFYYRREEKTGIFKLYRSNGKVIHNGRRFSDLECFLIGYTGGNFYRLSPKPAR